MLFGIPVVSEKVAKLLAEGFANLDRLRLASETEIKAINEITPNIVADVFQYFQRKALLKTEELESELAQNVIKKLMQKFKNLDAKKTAKNLLEQIERSKSRELRFFVNALTIPNVGASTARDLTNHFDSFEKLRNATEAELACVENIGEKTAKSIVDFFKNEKNMLDDLWEAMGEHAVCRQEVKQTAIPSSVAPPLQDITISPPTINERDFPEMLGMNFITLDFETANWKHSSPCEIGLTCVKDGTIIETKSWLIKPASHHQFHGFHIDRHGITPDMVENSPEFNELWNEIRPLLDNQFIIAHNASFDFSVLRKTLELYNLDYPTLSYGCTYLFARRLWLGLPSYSLDNLCRIKNIPLQHHRAAPDSKADAELALLLFKDAGIDSSEHIFDRLKIHCGRLFPGGYLACSKQLFRSFASKNGDVVKRDIHRGMEIVDEHTEPNPDSIFYGKSVVFTGALGSMPRSVAHQIIGNIGGIASDSVRKDTDFLVVGQQDYRIVGDSGMSSKQRKAVDMVNKGSPIEILSEEDFLKNL